MRVILAVGKGGVGKTTVAAATALAAAARGHRTALLSVDPAHSLSDALGAEVGGRLRPIAPGLAAWEVDALGELARSWEAVARWLRALLRSDVDEVVAEELLLFPGLEELVALRAIGEVERLGAFDLCVVDCPPTGSALRLLRLPEVLRLVADRLLDLERRGLRRVRPLLLGAGLGSLVPGEAALDGLESLHRDSVAVREILTDAERTSARLVLTPARVVVAESRRAWSHLSVHGVATDAVVANRLLGPLAGGAGLGRWLERERRELAEIEATFPVPLLRLPRAAREPVGLSALRELGEKLYGERDPAARLTTAPPLRLGRCGPDVLVELDLPGARKDDLRVVEDDGELRIGLGPSERRLVLPEPLSRHHVVSARLEGRVLRIRLAP